MTKKELEKAKEGLIADVARLCDVAGGNTWLSHVRFALHDLSLTLRNAVFIDTDDDALSISRCQGLLKVIGTAVDAENEDEALSGCVKLRDTLRVLACLADIPGKRTPRKVSDKLFKFTSEGLSDDRSELVRKFSQTPEERLLAAVFGANGNHATVAMSGHTRKSEEQITAETLTDIIYLFDGRRIAAAYRRRLSEAVGVDIIALMSKSHDVRIKAVKKLLRGVAENLLAANNLPKSVMYMILSTDLSEEGEQSDADDVLYSLRQTITAYRAVAIYCKEEISSWTKTIERYENKLNGLLAGRENASREETARFDKETQSVKRVLADATRIKSRHEDTFASVKKKLGAAQKAYAEKDLAAAEKFLSPDVPKDVLEKAAPWLFVGGKTEDSRDGGLNLEFFDNGFSDGEHNSHIEENHTMIIDPKHMIIDPPPKPFRSSLLFRTSELTVQRLYGLEFKEVLGGYVVTGMRRICIDTVLKIPADHNGKPVIEIGPSAFEFCASLTRVIIPDSVTEIGDHAFANCRSITSVTLGRKVTTIWDNAFYNCFRLIEVNNLSPLDIVAGSPDKGLVAYYAKYVYTGEGWRSFLRTTKSGFVFYDDGETYFLVGHVSHSADLTLPKPQDGGYGIYDYALYKSAGLRSLVIPDGVTSIGTGAFFASSSLMSVIIPVSVSVVGTAAFYGCSKLSDVYYAGNAEEWHKMSVGEDNEPLLYASLYWFSENPPEYAGNFWHYDEEGKPSKWILV